MAIRRKVWYVVLLQRRRFQIGKRRPAGDGMVRKREDGRWEGRIVVGHKKNGDSIFRYLSAGTQKELMKQLHRSIEEYRGVDLSEDSKMPLGQWLDRWLEEYIAPTVRETTLLGYRMCPRPRHWTSTPTLQMRCGLQRR